MTDEKQVPGVPDGWQLVAIREASRGDWTINADGNPYEMKSEHFYGNVWPIIERTLRDEHWAATVVHLYPELCHIEERDA